MGTQQTAGSGTSTPPETATSRASDGVGGAAAEADERREGAVQSFAEDRTGLGPDVEIDALDHLLGNAPPAQYDVVVDYDTPRGMSKLTFVIRAQDGDLIRRTEQRWRSETTGELDAIENDAELICLATVGLLGAGERLVRLDSKEFRTVKALKRDPDNPAAEPREVTHEFANPAEAVKARFRTQFGLVAGVAEEVRRISGYDRSRIGSARRRLVAAAGNS